jgi:hypothetical protein
MKSLRFVCSFAVFVFAILMIVLVEAQSNPVARADRENALPESQGLRAAAELGPNRQGLEVRLAKAVTYSSGGYEATSVAIEDLNGDGLPDLAVANWCPTSGSCPAGGEVSVLLGNGDGTFQAPAGYSSGGALAHSVAIGDVNGDGHPDLVVANECQDYSNCNGGGEVSVLLGNGDGTFRGAVSYSSGGYTTVSVAIGDVNGDGHPDLVVANECYDSTTCDNGGEVGVLLGNGDGTFQTAVSYSSGGYLAQNVAIWDLNGDGHPDLVVANGCESSPTCDNGGGISVLMGNGDGTFKAAVSYSSGGIQPNSVAIGDVNGDGHPDVAVANYCQNPSTCRKDGFPASVGVLLGNGDGTFQAPVSYSLDSPFAESVAIGDVNGDGHPDLIVASLCRGLMRCNRGGVNVMLGNGDGTFQAPVGYGSGGYAANFVAVGDVNGDGRPDVVAANLYVSQSRDTTGMVGVLLNNFTVSTATRVTSSPNPSRVKEPVTLTATVTSNSSVPNGSTVAFYNGSTKIGTGTTSNGVASLTTSLSKAGKYTIKASYPGDAFHKASSGTVKQVVKL